MKNFKCLRINLTKLVPELNKFKLYCLICLILRPMVFKIMVSGPLFTPKNY